MLVQKRGPLAPLATIALAQALLAAPPLTTIQDVLYKADGTRFNGIAVISWNSFEAVDRSNVTTQSVTTSIVNGALRVQLVPTTNATQPASYTVKYNSDGRVQFTERWAVPPGTSPLRVRDVRISVLPGTAVSPPAALLEDDVVGLSADLAARPTKGPGYAPGRALFVNSAGSLEAVSGTAADCVRVDGTSGPCGSSEGGPAFVDGETPGGIVDGANASFTLANAPNPPSSLALYRNGLRQKLTQDFTLAGSSIQFLSDAIPQPADTVLASYRLGGAPAGLGVSAPAVLCSNTGAATSSTALTSLGSCTIPAALLGAGDRVEIRFDFSHEGSATGFTFQMRWGNTIAVQRSAGSDESLITGRAEAGIQSAGAQLSVQTWGGVLPLASGISMATDSPLSLLVLDFQARMSQITNDTITLRSFTVTRYSR